MADAAPGGFHAVDLFAALARHEVDMVVVGGVAGRLHGARRRTHDLDICPAWHTANLRRLSVALTELGAELRLRPELRPTVVYPNPELLRELSASLWRTRSGNIDVLIGIADAPGSLACFPELAARATEFQLDDGSLLIAGLQDLIRAKEIADRPKDRQALPELRALRDASQARPLGASAAAASDRPHPLARRGGQRPLTPRPAPHRPGPAVGH